MKLETERLLLRPWKETDAEALYAYAKNPKVGPIAGWPVHTSVENSRQIIRDVLSAEEIYAVILKDEKTVVGSIGLMVGERSNIGIDDNECEIGYWIGVPYWGQGFIPEAVQRLLSYGFEVLDFKTIWCGYFDGNEQSHRVQEKCGFQYHHTLKNQPCPLINDVKTVHISCITKTQWKLRKWH